jgi:PAS domain S-box-containing protein
VRFSQATIDALSTNLCVLNELGDLLSVVTRFGGAGPIRVAISHEDITARKLAEQALADSEAELRAIFASIQDVVLVINREGLYQKVVTANPALLLYPPEKLLGKTLKDVFSPELAEKFQQHISEVLKNQDTVQIEYELIIQNQPIWFEAHISPLTEDSTLWVARDITKRKHAESEISFLKNQLELTLNSAGEGIYGTDSQGIITFANPTLADMVGWSIDELVGNSSHTLFHHSRADRSPYPLEECNALNTLRDCLKTSNHAQGDVGRYGSSRHR